MRHDREALVGFIGDATHINYADAAQMLAAVIQRTGASDRQLALAALELLRELTVTRRATGDGTT